jgi:chemotaxis protein methyltransferase CheR
MALQVDLLADTPVDYPTDVERVEIDALTQAIHQYYGFDFRSYAVSSLKRRLWKFAEIEGLGTLSALQEHVLHDAGAMERLLATLSVKVTSMFRDPEFYRAFREYAVPLLRTYPSARLWHAGCASGEEVYSMAVLLREEGILERSRIYATDINLDALRRAKAGIYPIERMQEYTRNYIDAGGKASFSDYYTASHASVRMDPSLVRTVVFAQHDLATDHSFAEVNGVICRNVLIYFNRELQDRVHEVFHAALVPFGVLALGAKESLRATRWARAYEALDDRRKIYRKVAA